jgi:hypothetical protein
MTIPNWIDDTVAALYGKNYSTGADIDASFVAMLHSYVEPMWSIILKRFDGTPRPEPIVIPVDSPTGSPTTLADKGTEVLVFDMHLLWLIMALTMMSTAQVNSDIFVPAIASMYAERAFSAGRIETATLIGAGSRIAVASSPSIVFSAEVYSFIRTNCAAQWAFIVAHELAHLAFSEYPGRVLEHAEEHRKLLRRAISAAYPDTAKLTHDDMELLRIRMEQLGYSPSARTRYFSKLQETEQPLPSLKSWDRVSGNKEFMIEVMADHMACTALLRSHRIDHAPEFLATAAAFAVYNLSVLQYLDQLVSGQHPDSLAKNPDAYIWQALMRGAALRESLKMQAFIYAQAGEPKYDRETFTRMSDTTSAIFRHIQEYIMDPLLWSMDFEALESRFSADETITSITRGVSRAPDDVRRFLGFGPVEDKATFTKYLNVRRPSPNT